VPGDFYGLAAELCHVLQMLFEASGHFMQMWQLYGLLLVHVHVHMQVHVLVNAIEAYDF